MPDPSNLDAGEGGNITDYRIRQRFFTDVGCVPLELCSLLRENLDSRHGEVGRGRDANPRPAVEYQENSRKAQGIFSNARDASKSALIITSHCTVVADPVFSFSKPMSSVNCSETPFRWTTVVLAPHLPIHPHLRVCLRTDTVGEQPSRAGDVHSGRQDVKFTREDHRLLKKNACLRGNVTAHHSVCRSVTARVEP